MDDLIERLKPCPVCGEQPRWRGTRSDYARGIFRLQCLGETHLFQSYGPDEERAITAWNTRAELSSLRMEANITAPAPGSFVDMVQDAQERGALLKAGSLSACDKCGAEYPSAPTGHLHKCGQCSGKCYPIAHPTSGSEVIGRLVGALDAFNAADIDEEQVAAAFFAGLNDKLDRAKEIAARCAARQALAAVKGGSSISNSQRETAV